MHVLSSNVPGSLLACSNAPAGGLVSFGKFINPRSKVALEASSNHVVGSYPATLPAQPAWGHELLGKQHATPAAPERHSDATWKKLYEENYLAARRFLLSMGVHHDAIEDACQDVFLQAFRYLPKFRGECSFKTWLYRICASEARRHRQRVRLRKSLLQLLSFETEDNSTTQGEWGGQRAEKLVRRALNQLPETERLVFVLYELEGMPGKEIAEIARCPEATVWRRLHYARKTFREYFDAHGDSA